MRAAVLFSGGKDSTLAAFLAKKAGAGIRCLVSMFPVNKESYMFHHPNIGLTRMQAESMGTPIITKDTAGEKEKELLDLERSLLGIRDDIDSVVSGAVASEYQRSRISGICSKLGLESVTPLWHKDPLELWKLCLDNGFKVMITAVACEGLNKTWLGRVIDEKGLAELKRLSEKHRFHLSGEGGEFETLVLDCPLFKKRIQVIKAKAEWSVDSGTYVIEKAGLKQVNGS